MKKTYKLACNFNTVEISDISTDDLLEVAKFDEVGPGGEIFVEDSVLVARLLQREYDIIAEVKTANVIGVGAAPIKQAQAPVEGPSERQIEWARNLGMDHPERHSKQEVAAYIHRNRSK
jgi:hypothetical protein